jgi:hypothetical protein
MTCLGVLDEHVGFNTGSFQWVPHLMTVNEAQRWIAFSEELVQVWRHARETSIDNLLTGDESWFYYASVRDSAWALRERLFRLEHQRKFIWKGSGFHSMADVRYPQSSSMVCWDAGRTRVLLHICSSYLERNSCEATRRRTLRDIYVHRDNAPAHNAKWQRLEIA